MKSQHKIYAKWSLPKTIAFDLTGRIRKNAKPEDQADKQAIQFNGVSMRVCSANAFRSTLENIISK